MGEWRNSGKITFKTVRIEPLISHIQCATNQVLMLEVTRGPGELFHAIVRTMIFMPARTPWRLPKTAA